MNFDKNQLKCWNSTKRHLFNEELGNFDSATNSNLELARNNSGSENLTKNSTLESVGVDFKLFDLELAWVDFGMESAQQDFIL